MLFFIICLIFCYLSDSIKISDSLVIIISVLIIYTVIGVPLLTYWQTKRQYASNKNLQEPVEYEFTDDKIEITGSSFNSTLTWESIYKVRESKNLFYIYQSKGIANILPKRYFAAAEVEQFRDLVKRKAIKSEFRKK